MTREEMLKVIESTFDNWSNLTVIKIYSDVVPCTECPLYKNSICKATESCQKSLRRALYGEVAK
jgi:hypothetical protein